MLVVEFSGHDPHIRQARLEGPHRADQIGAQDLLGLGAEQGTRDDVGNAIIKDGPRDMKGVALDRLLRVEQPGHVAGDGFLERGGIHHAQRTRLAGLPGSLVDEPVKQRDACAW